MYCATTGCQDVMPYPYELQTEIEAYLAKSRYVTASSRLTIEEELLILNQVGRWRFRRGHLFCGLACPFYSDLDAFYPIA